MGNKFLGYEKEIRDGNILSIQMNLLNKCTSKCLSCRKYTWPDVQLDYDTIKNTLMYLKGQGLQTVVFSGGEPLLYKDFDKVISLCEMLNIKYSLITTLIIKDIELLKRVAKTAYRIHVSVDSVDEEKYAYIRGVYGLKIAKESIKIIAENRPKEMIPIRISSTMSNMNYAEVNELYNFAKENGCLINFYNLHTWDDLKMDIHERMEFQQSLFEIVVDEKNEGKTISNARQLYIDNLFGSADKTYKKSETTCYMPHIGAIIDANGDIYPCCKLLNDNGEYGEQTKFAYGNIMGVKSFEEAAEQFKKRFYILYGTGCEICKECAQRYSGEIEDLAKIYDEDEKEPIFL